MIRRAPLPVSPPGFGWTKAAVSDAGSSHARGAGGRDIDASWLEGWLKSLRPTEIWMTEKLCRDHLTLPATGMAPLAARC